MPYFSPAFAFNTTGNYSMPPPGPASPFSFVGPALVRFVLIVFYVYIATIITKNRQHLGNVAFQSCVLSLAVADILGQLNMTFPPPERMFAVFRREPWNWIAWYTIQLLPWFGCILNTMLLAANRLVSVIFWQRYSDIFSERNTKLIICGVWVLVFLIPSPFLFRLGHKVIQYEANGEVKVFDWTPFMKWLEVCVACVASAGTFIIYLMVIIFIRTNRLKATWSKQKPANTNKENQQQQQQNDKVEQRIFIQAFVISAIMLITVIVSYSIYVLPFEIYLPLTQYTQMINYGVSPFLYVAFSKEIRRLAIPFEIQKVQPISGASGSGSGGKVVRTGSIGKVVSSKSERTL